MSANQVTVKVCSCPSTKYKGKCRCDTTVTLTEQNGVFTDADNFIWNKGNGHIYTKTTDKYVEPPPSVPQDNINLCFVGGVSTGKSTILNAIFSEQLTQCKIKRTTMVPTVYIENPDHSNPFDKADTTERIFAEISKKNKEIIDLTERGIAAEYSEMVFNVGKLDINILEDSFVNVYDIPGLNDARTKDVYYTYLDNNFHKFNLMILLVDIQSGLNTSDEMDMLRFVASHVRHHKELGRKIYTLVVVNKADDMQWNDDTQSLELTGELSEMYEQVNNTVKSEFTEKAVQDQLIGILPLCAADAYLYRMVKKHGAGFHLTAEQVLKIGINHMGKRFSKEKPDVQKNMVSEILSNKDFVDDMIRLSGFQKFVDMLSGFLNENGVNKQIRIDNVLFEINKLPALDHALGQDFNGVVKQHVQMLQKIAKIDKGEFDSRMTSMLNTLKELFNKAIKTYRGLSTELIVFYQNFKKCVLDAYFTEYDDACDYNEKGFSTVLVQHIIGQVYVKLSNGGHLVDDYLEIFNTLICVGAFSKDNVQSVVDTVVNNDHPVKFIETAAETDALLQMLTKIKSLDVNLTQFMRHILLERYMNQDEYQTIHKHMSYKNRGEIALSTFLAPRSGDRRKHITKKIITWQPDDGLDLLDMFYLSL